jgi:YesN/AraC family two-component response regulator
LVFTTAFDHYALKAIKFCAIDYLLKPIDLNELRIAVAKAEKRLNREYLNKNLEVLVNNLKSGSQNNHRIALSTLEGLLFVNVRDIIYCESSGPYTKFIFKQADKICTSKHLKEYEDLLKGMIFSAFTNLTWSISRKLKNISAGRRAVDHVRWSNPECIKTTKGKFFADLFRFMNLSHYFSPFFPIT